MKTLLADVVFQPAIFLIVIFISEFVSFFKNNYRSKYVSLNILYNLDSDTQTYSVVLFRVLLSAIMDQYALQ
jgi:hypothetical protein